MGWLTDDLAGFWETPATAVVSDAWLCPVRAVIVQWQRGL